MKDARLDEEGKGFWELLISQADAGVAQGWGRSGGHLRSDHTSLLERLVSFRRRKGGRAWFGSIDSMQGAWEILRM